jgi:hypothetical protein
MAFEVAFVLVLGVVLVALGRPLAMSYAERMKRKFSGLSDAEVKLSERISSLEQEIAEIKRQMQEVQATADFAVKQSGGAKSDVKLVEEPRQ